MMKRDELKDAVKLLEKYKDMHPIDLMADISERLGALLLKMADLNADDIAEEGAFYTFNKFVNDTFEKIRQLKKGLRELR